MIFRKIVSHLAYSPAMIWQLANYDAKVKQIYKYNKRILLLCILNIVVIIAILLTNSPLMKSNVVEKTTVSNDALSYAINVVDLTSSTNNPPILLPSHNVKYTITVANNSDKPVLVSEEIDLADMLEYADVISTTNLIDKKFLLDFVLQPKTSHDIDFTIKTPASFSNKPVNGLSHDCVSSLQIANLTDNRQVNCSFVKKFELFSHSIAQNYNINFLIILILLVAVFLIKILYSVKLHLLSKEIKSIRHKINQGNF